MLKKHITISIKHPKLMLKVEINSVGWGDFNTEVIRGVAGVLKTHPIHIFKI